VAVGVAVTSTIKCIFTPAIGQGVAVVVGVAHGSTVGVGADVGLPDDVGVSVGDGVVVTSGWKADVSTAEKQGVGVIMLGACPHVAVRVAGHIIKATSELMMSRWRE